MARQAASLSQFPARPGGLDASDITVEDRDGDVVLAGSVPSYPQSIEAAAVARRVAGVKGVHNHLEVALPPGDRGGSNDCRPYRRPQHYERHRDS